MLQRPVEREVHDRELEARADAREEVEAAARHLRAALHVDRAEQLAEREVVERLEVELGRCTVRAQRHEVILAARGNALDDDVLDPGERGVGGLLGRRDGVLGALDALAQLLRLGDEGGLLVLRRLSDPLAVRVLRSAELFEGRDGGTPFAVGGEGRVDRVGRLAARLLRALDQLGIVAEEYGIDHRSSLLSDRTPHPAIVLA